WLTTEGGDDQREHRTHEDDPMGVDHVGVAHLPPQNRKQAGRKNGIRKMMAALKIARGGDTDLAHAGRIKGSLAFSTDGACHMHHTVTLIGEGANLLVDKD